MATFGEKLREVRGEMSRADLSEKSGISVSYIASLEINRYPNPTTETLFKLASALGVGCDVFADCDFSGDKPPKKRPRGRPKK